LVVGLLSLGLFSACIDTSPDVGEEEDVGEAELAQGGNQDPVKRGKKLFKNETFDGNDRTCASCHRGKHGTISPDDVEELFQCDPDDPLFRSIDSDDGVGDDYTRLREHATIRIVLPLPPNIRPLDDLEATHVVVNRGVPTMVNSALDESLLMYDGRNDSLEEQALGAVHAHTENGREPTAQELSDIATFQRTLFSNDGLEDLFSGGPPSPLPEGKNAKQRRGREHFLPGGMCGGCHGGPMLNEDQEAEGIFRRFRSVFAGELDFQPNELREWAVIDPDTGEFLFDFGFPFPDPGLALITGNPDDVTGFKIPTLWGIKHTAPYFHDGSAKTLEDLMSHYASFFSELGEPVPTAQEQEDMIAFMKLL
jgi:cytochrome c peroxidase